MGEQQQQRPVGRFVIVHDEAFQTTIRLDTATGEAWLLTKTTRQGYNDVFWWDAMLDYEPQPAKAKGA